MDAIVITGNGPLKGETHASGAKNAALPILASALLAEGEHTFRNVPDLVDASLDLLIDGASGLWHLANDGAVTWAEFAERAARQAGLNVHLIEPCSLESLRLPAARWPSPSASTAGITSRPAKRCSPSTRGRSPPLWPRRRRVPDRPALPPPSPRPSLPARSA